MTEQFGKPGQPDIDVRDSQGVYIGDHGRVFNLWRDPQTRALIIAGILVTVFGLFISTMLLWPEGPHVGLAVAAVEVTEPGKLDADIYGAGEDRSVPKKGTIDATVVDIALKNNGNAPALITGAKVDILFAEEFEDCANAGGGPVVVSAGYSVKLPNPLPPLPFSITRELRFEVGPGAVDRMALGIGPQQHSISFSKPFVFAARISFVHDNSDRPLEVGTVAMLTTSGQGDFQIARVHDMSCVERMSKRLDALYEIQAIRSAELDRLRHAYQALTTPDPAPAQTRCREWPGTAITELCGRYRREQLVVTVATGQPLVINDSLIVVRIDTGTSKTSLVYAMHCTNIYDEPVWAASTRIESDTRAAWTSCPAAADTLLKVDESTHTVTFTLPLTVDFSFTSLNLSAEIQRKQTGAVEQPVTGAGAGAVTIERGN